MAKHMVLTYLHFRILELETMPAQNSFHHQLQDGLDFKALWASNSMLNQPYILAIAGSNSPDKYH